MISEGSITVLIIVWYTLLQRLVPSELLGRVASLDWLISAAGVPVSFAIVGPLSGAIGVDATLIAAGIAGARSRSRSCTCGARGTRTRRPLEVAERSAGGARLGAWSTPTSAISVWWSAACAWAR